jgi:hypothetical protein
MAVTEGISGALQLSLAKKPTNAVKEGKNIISTAKWGDSSSLEE